MNILAALKIYCYGTPEGACKAVDTRGDSRGAGCGGGENNPPDSTHSMEDWSKVNPRSKGPVGGDTAARFHKESEWWNTAPGSRLNPIDCGDDIKKAAVLIASGKRVKLNQPDQVSTLVNMIKTQAVEAKAKGQEIPDYNIEAISVKGTNLFAQRDVGVPRVKMPQFAGWVDKGSKAAELLPKNAPADAEVDLSQQFIKSLQDKGIKSEDVTVNASHLRSTQSELDGVKVGFIADRIRSGKLPPAPIFITRDNYILDGHHRWAATMVVDADNNKVGDMQMTAHKLDCDIGTALGYGLDFQKEWGLSPAKASHKKIEWLPSMREKRRAK